MAGGSSSQVASSGLGIRLLGPVEVTIGGQPRPLPKLVHRILLAILVSADGHVVPASSLVEELWHEDSSPRRRKNLQTHVYQLRRVLHGFEPGCDMIVTRPPGYLLTVTDCELDLYELDGLVATAREAARQGDFALARSLYRQALALWRGPTLADVHACAPVLGGLADRLEERRIGILEERIEADLAAGLHADLIPELSGLIAQHPLRERLRARLMLSLYRSGRQADALAAYQDARNVLLDQLGLDPGAELQDLHQRILNGDTAIAESTGSAERPPETVSVAATAAVPHELPAPDTHFVGRDAELAALTGLPGPITAISGTAGIGKTALAVRWAHQLAARFPDGQLYVNLRGYDPGEPVPAADALAAFLRSLGVADRDIPVDCAERAARFRSLLADRRVLVVLDNAADAEQVRPLLPGASGCLTVITSRNPLAGLIARTGAQRIDLSPLSADGAIGLLRILVGGRVDAEAHAVALVARLCGRLPLALRVFAERAAGRPALPLTALASELAESRRRLDLLDAGGDSHASVRTVLSWSYRQLGPEASRLFRLCALYPGAELDADAAAALAGRGVADVREPLTELARASLVHVSEQGRYLMHDLLREYARELAVASLAEAERHAALTRLYEYYLGKTAAAVDSLFPAERDRRSLISGNTGSSPAFGSPEAARQWLDGERAMLLTLVAHAAREDRPGCAAKLALTLHRYLSTYGYYHEELAVAGRALDAARRIGDYLAEAWLLNYLGGTDWHLGRLRLASECHERALSLFRKAADRMGEADVLCSLGAYDLRQGRYQQAASQYRTAAALAREADDWRGEQRALTSLAVLDSQHGRYQHAADRLHRALSLARRVGHRHLEAHTLSMLGQVELRWGRYRLAASHLAEALLLNHDLGNRKIEADTLSALGLLSSRQGDHRRAIGQLRQSLALCRALGDLMIEQQTLNNLGEVFLALGRPGPARAWYDRALSLSGQIGDRFEQARAYAGLAAVADALEDLTAGRAHWQRAMQIYGEVGAPEAEQIRARIRCR